MSKKRAGNCVFMAGTLFFMLFASVRTTAAAENSVTVQNHRGEPLLEKENGCYESFQEVLFCLNEKELREGECFVYCNSLDGGNHYSAWNPVKDGVFVCQPAENLPDGIYRVRFCRYDKETGRYEALEEGEKVYQVDFTPENADSLQIEFEHEEGIYRENVLYLSGETPRLRVTPSAVGKTIISHETEEKRVVYELGEETLELSMEEGFHTLNVWVRQPDGRNAAANGFPVSFCYDRTPPQEPVFSISMNGGHVFSEMKGYQYFSNGTITVHADSQDDISGIAEIQMFLDDGSQTPGNEICLQKPFRGTVRAKAIDRAGNESCTVICGKQLLLESQAPDIELKKSEEEGEVRFHIQLSDSQAGLWRVICRYGEDRLYDREFDRKGSRQEEYEFVQSIPKEEIGNEEREFSVIAVDNAGNEAVLDTVCSKKDRSAPVIRFLGASPFQVTCDEVEILTEIEDENLDRSQIAMEAVCRDEKGTVIETIPLSNLKNRFTQEGSYTLHVLARDSFGNENSDEISFTIDRQAPEVEGLQKYDGKYLQEFCLDQKLSGMLRDASMVTCRMLLNGEEFDETSRVTEPGKYTLRILTADEAGNESEESAEFVIDTEAPKILLYESDSELEVHLENPDDSLESICMDGKIIYSQAASSGEKRADFSHVMQGTGKHTIEVKAVDAAGNSEKICKNIEAAKAEVKKAVSENRQKSERVKVSGNSPETLEKTDKNHAGYWILAVILTLAGAAFWGFLAWCHKIDTGNEV